MGSKEIASMNRIIGIFLIIQGIWMIADGSIGHGFNINQKVDGVALYAYSIPIIIIGLYFFIRKNEG